MYESGGIGPFPSALRRGGCAINKKLRSILSSRRRGGDQQPTISLEFTHHPVRFTKEATRYLINISATPPRRGGEKLVPILVIRHLIARRPLNPRFARTFPPLEAGNGDSISS